MKSRLNNNPLPNHSGSATSAAKIGYRCGVKVRRSLCSDVSLGQLYREISLGEEYFWGKRPTLDRLQGFGRV
ncbi:MAG: hypothetical protein RLZZ15_167 [Verrucomicrobiota bacterium]|jgi:hypothetical protein